MQQVLISSQDVKFQREILRSSSQCNTRLYVVTLQNEWTPSGFKRDFAPNVRSADVSNKFKVGDTAVVKLFVGGPEEEKKADAIRRCANEYKRLDDLRLKIMNDETADKNWFVMALGKGDNFRLPTPGPFVLLEQGECSLGHLLHQRIIDCKTQNHEPTSASVSSIDSEFYTKDHCFSFIVQIHGALNFLHKHNMMHRDLKSYNVLLFHDKTLCKLADLEDCRDVSLRMTAKMGTTWWAPPELYRDIDNKGKAEYGFAAEWYSFGLLICELLFREEPFVCYYTGTMSDKALDASRVYSDKFLSQLPRFTEVEHDKHAMYIDHTTPGQPKVVLNRSRCVFSNAFSVQEASNTWDLVEKLLMWEPNERIPGPRLAQLIGSQIRPFSSGNPPPIRLPNSEKPTDTGAASSDTTMSWRPAFSVQKVYLLAQGCDLSDKSITDEIRQRLEDRKEDIPGMFPDQPEISSLKFSYSFKPANQHFVLSIIGSEALVELAAQFCRTNAQFVNFISDQFKYHRNRAVQGLRFKLKVNGQPSDVNPSIPTNLDDTRD